MDKEYGGSSAVAISLTATDVEIAKIPKSDSNVVWNATAQTTIQTKAAAALSADNLDHLLLLDGATQKYPEQAVTDSILAKMLVKADPAVLSEYDNSTDSLEAISDKITALNNISTANVNTEVDNALNTIVPASPTAGSVNDILSKVAGGNTFDKSTDSLEMLSDKIGAFSGDGGAVADDSVKAILDIINTAVTTTLDGIVDNIILDTAIKVVASGSKTIGTGATKFLSVDSGTNGAEILSITVKGVVGADWTIDTYIPADDAVAAPAAGDKRATIAYVNTDAEGGQILVGGFPFNMFLDCTNDSGGDDNIDQVQIVYRSRGTLSLAWEA